MLQDTPLFEASRKRFMNIGEYLNIELEKLYKEGVLTKLDFDKLIDDSRLSAQAVSDALYRNDYPENMQKTLVEKLIGQYEESVEKILNEARSRRYTDKRIENRIIEIENKAISQMNFGIDDRLLTKRQVEEIRKVIQKEHNIISKGIRTIPLNHPKRDELIESWISDYCKTIYNLLNRYLPRISDKNANDSVNEPSKEKKKILIRIFKRR